MYSNETQDRIRSAYKLLLEDTTTLEKFEHIRSLIKGINPRLDEGLNKVSHGLSLYGKLSKGEVIELTTEYLPQQTEEQKKRKKKLLLLIRNWKELQSEVERVRTELKDEGSNSHQQPTKSFGKIIAGAKGPFGIITLIAVAAVGILAYTNANQPKRVNSRIEPSPTISAKKSAVKGIIVNGKKIPLSEIYVGTGPDCDSPHYHGLNHTAAKALDGTFVSDPGGCGFGKVKDVAVVDIE